MSYPPRLSVWDRPPIEPILDTELADFWVVVLSWSLLGWFLRLCYVSLQLLELRT